MTFCSNRIQIELGEFLSDSLSNFFAIEKRKIIFESLRSSESKNSNNERGIDFLKEFPHTRKFSFKKSSGV